MAVGQERQLTANNPFHSATAISNNNKLEKEGGKNGD